VAHRGDEEQHGAHGVHLAVYAPMIPVLKVNAAEVFGLGCFGVAMGLWLKRRLPILDRLNIPAPIAGGMVYALVTMALRDRVANFEFDGGLRDLAQMAFMTTVGLAASARLIREGGVGVAKLLAISVVGAVLQNALGMGIAKLLGVDPRLGILAGAVSLAGGPATSLAFGPMFEKLGVAGATTAAFASATFGICVAGLISARIGAQIIRRRALKPAEASPVEKRGLTPQVSSDLLRIIVILGICMGAGAVVSGAIERTGIILPGYIGAMIVAAVVRNSGVRIPEVDLLTVGKVSLYLFIVMALLTLKLWELVHLALPILIILIAQVALVWGMCLTLSYWVMGRDYEAAVTTAGFCGYMLGTTSNAVASMEELVEKFGAAPRSFLVVPIVGAFLIDFTDSIIITASANLWR
jgi:glutamate:Na+ symporter, ESS family